MKFEINKCKIEQSGDRFVFKALIPFDQYNNLDKLNKICNADSKKTFELKKKSNKRSLNGNAAMWVLLNEMATKLHTSKDELYLEMLDRYGVFTHVVVKPDAVYRVKQEWRTVREIGKVSINGKTGVQLQCYYGSSQYDQNEFSILLDGIISEAAELDIHLISQEERNSYINNWEGDKN